MPRERRMARSDVAISIAADRHITRSRARWTVMSTKQLSPIPSSPARTNSRAPPLRRLAETVEQVCHLTIPPAEDERRRRPAIHVASSCGVRLRAWRYSVTSQTRGPQRKRLLPRGRSEAGLVGTFRL